MRRGWVLAAGVRSGAAAGGATVVVRSPRRQHVSTGVATACGAAGGCQLRGTSATGLVARVG